MASGILACPISKSDVPSSPARPVQASNASASCNVSFASQTRSCTPSQTVAPLGELLPEKLLPYFVLEMFTSVVQLLIVLHKVHNSLLVLVNEIYVGHVSRLVTGQ